MTLVAKNPGNVAGWVSDANFKVRGALAMTADGGRTVLIREDEIDDWKTLITWDPDDAQNSFPVGFTQDGKSIYLVGGGHDITRGDFAITRRDNADTTCVVAFTRDNGPVAFYAYDRPTRKVTFLFDNQPDLNRYTLATMQAISFTSRDGLTIHGYLTLPP